MKNLKKIALFAMVIFMLMPVFSMAKGFSEDLGLTAEQLKQIKQTIDISDKELYPVYETRMMSAGEGADFAVFHRKYDKLSMSDDAFVKSECSIEKDGNNYVFVFKMKPVTKRIAWTDYVADCTELSFLDKNGNKLNAEPISWKDACNHDPKKEGNNVRQVPAEFKITVPEDYLYDEPVTNGDLMYNSHFKITFETNLEYSGALGVIGDAMMNRNARLGLDV